MDIHINYSKTCLMLFKLRAKGRQIWLNINTLKMYFDILSVQGLKICFMIDSTTALYHIKECKIELSNNI